LQNILESAKIKTNFDYAMSQGIKIDILDEITGKLIHCV